MLQLLKAVRDPERNRARSDDCSGSSSGFVDHLINCAGGILSRGAGKSDLPPRTGPVFGKQVSSPSSPIG